MVRIIEVASWGIEMLWCIVPVATWWMQPPPPEVVVLVAMIRRIERSVAVLNNLVAEKGMTIMMMIFVVGIFVFVVSC